MQSSPPYFATFPNRGATYATLTLPRNVQVNHLLGIWDQTLVRVNYFTRYLESDSCISSFSENHDTNEDTAAISALIGKRTLGSVLLKVSLLVDFSCTASDPS